MKKSRFCSALLFVSLLFVLLPATAKAAMWDVPVGPGETFRWVFVTSNAKTHALNNEIDSYNDFINDTVMPPLALLPLTGVAGKSTLGDVTWKAIASTCYTDAIDNIGDSTAPIYGPFGGIVAPSYLGLFDPYPVAAINITAVGGLYEDRVWTGSGVDGRAIFGGLGSGIQWWEGPASYPAAMTGYSAAGLEAQWLLKGMRPDWELYPLYAISEELRVVPVVPVPGALILAATGLLSSTLCLKRLRRKHQE